MLERDIQTAVRLALGECSGVVAWRNNVGVAQVRGTTIRYGLGVGSADLVGIVTMPNGIGCYCEWEVKTDVGRLSPEQIMRQDLVRGLGGFACTVRSAADAVASVARCRAWEDR